MARVGLWLPGKPHEQRKMELRSLKRCRGWHHDRCGYGYDAQKDDDQVIVVSTEKPVRVFFLTGKPLGGPVAWHGPIVVKTQEELRTAFDESQNGPFIK
jgi:redox-sensitive bicupin YhaK (pirin superfamily)